MNKLRSNHAVYMIGLLISLIGSTLLGIAIAGDLLSHIDQNHSLFSIVGLVQVNHVIMFAVGGILMAIFVWRVQIYRGKFDLVSDLITLIVNALIIVTACLFTVVEGLGAQIADKDTMVEKWLVNSIVTNQFYGWVCFSVIVVMLGTGMSAYRLMQEKHEIHPASKEIELGKKIGYYTVSGAWVVVAGILGLIIGLGKLVLGGIFGLLKGILPSGEGQTAKEQIAIYKKRRGDAPLPNNVEPAEPLPAE